MIIERIEEEMNDSFKLQYDFFPISIEILQTNLEKEGCSILSYFVDFDVHTYSGVCVVQTLTFISPAKNMVDPSTESGPTLRINL